MIHYYITRRTLKKSKRKLKKYLEKNDSENMTTENLWDEVRSSAKRKVYNNTSLPQVTRKTPN